MAKKAAKRKKKVEPGSRGLAPAEVAGGAPPAAVRELRKTVEADGGSVLGTYRDPLGGKWQLLVALPLERVEPTPFQRDLSAAHVKRLGECIGRLDRFLDPIVVVRDPEKGVYWTPNGHHRLASLRGLGSKAIVALLVPETEMAYQILALNTEKAHNLREKALEVIRMARDLAQIEPGPERDYADVFEEPSFLTLGACYERKGRFAGSLYHPVLRRVESFLDQDLPRALEVREGRAARLVELDEAVTEAADALKARGFESPYLKAFVVARVNPLRFKKGAADLDATLEHMLEKARAFDASKVKADQVARSGGPLAE